jgi:hypothetical protein
MRVRTNPGYEQLAALVRSFLTCAGWSLLPSRLCFSLLLLLLLALGIVAEFKTGQDVFPVKARAVLLVLVPKRARPHRMRTIGRAVVSFSFGSLPDDQCAIASVRSGFPPEPKCCLTISPCLSLSPRRYGSGEKCERFQRAATVVVAERIFMANKILGRSLRGSDVTSSNI